MLKAELKVVGGRHHGRIIPLNTSKFLVGREQDCQLRPNSEMVSRHHCVFVLDEYTVRLRDLGSTNGTFVNNEQIRGIVTLNQSDLIRIGKLDLELVVYDAAAVPDVGPTTDSETVATTGSETSLLPGLNDSATEGGLAGSGDTTVFISIPKLEEGAEGSSGDSTADLPVSEQPAEQAPVEPAAQAEPVSEAPAAYPMQMPMEGAAPPPQQAYPQQPMVPPGYPQQPYVQQPGYPYGYPQQPGYPMMPQPGYPMGQPGYPQFQHYPQQQTFGAVPMEESVEELEAPAPDSSKVSAPPIQLPDPSTTGAKADAVIGSDPNASKPEPEKVESENSEGESAEAENTEKEPPKQNVKDAIDSILQNRNRFQKN